VAGAPPGAGRNAPGDAFDWLGAQDRRPIVVRSDPGPV
jgi:hypothetical protein